MEIKSFIRDMHNISAHFSSTNNILGRPLTQFGLDAIEKYSTSTNNILNQICIETCKGNLTYFQYAILFGDSILIEQLYDMGGDISIPFYNGQTICDAFSSRYNEGGAFSENKTAKTLYAEFINKNKI